MDGDRAPAARKLPQTAANFFVGTNSRVPRMTLAQSSHTIPLPSVNSPGLRTPSRPVFSRMRQSPFTSSPTTDRLTFTTRSPPKNGKVARAVQLFSAPADKDQEAMLDLSPSPPRRPVPITLETDLLEDPATHTGSATLDHKAHSPEPEHPLDLSRSDTSHLRTGADIPTLLSSSAFHINPASDSFLGIASSEQNAGPASAFSDVSTPVPSFSPQPPTKSVLTAETEDMGRLWLETGSGMLQQPKPAPALSRPDAVITSADKLAHTSPHLTSRATSFPLCPTTDCNAPADMSFPLFQADVTEAKRIADVAAHESDKVDHNSFPAGSSHLALVNQHHTVPAGEHPESTSHDDLSLDRVASPPGSDSGASYIIEENVLSDLIDGIADKFPPQGYDSVRDSLIERTASWLKSIEIQDDARGRDSLQSFLSPVDTLNTGEHGRELPRRNSATLNGMEVDDAAHLTYATTIVRSYSQRSQAGGATGRWLKKVPGRLQLPEREPAARHPTKKAPGRLAIPQFSEETPAPSKLLPGRLDPGPRDEEVMSVLKAIPGRLQLPHRENDVVPAAEVLPGQLIPEHIDERKSDDKAAPGQLALHSFKGEAEPALHGAPGRLVLPEKEKNTEAHEKRAPGRLVLPQREVKTALVTKDTPGRVVLPVLVDQTAPAVKVVPGRLKPLERKQDFVSAEQQAPGRTQIPDYHRPHAQRRRRSSVEALEQRHLQQSVASSDHQPRPSEELLHVRSSVFDDVREACNCPLLSDSDTVALSNQDRQRVRRRVAKSSGPTTPQDSDEVASINVGRRLTLKRMSGFSVLSTPRRMNRALSANLVQNAKKLTADTTRRARNDADERREADTLKMLQLQPCQSAISARQNLPVSTNSTTPQTNVSDMWTLDNSNTTVSVMTEGTSVSQYMQPYQAPQAIGGSLARASAAGGSQRMARSLSGTGSLAASFRSDPNERCPGRGECSHHLRRAAAGPEMARSLSEYHLPRTYQTLDHTRPSVKSPPRRSDDHSIDPTHQVPPNPISGFDISIQLQEPITDPHCSQGTLMEFGFRVLVRPVNDQSIITDQSARSTHRSAQYEHEDLSPSFMSKVQAEAQEHLLRNLSSPAQRMRRLASQESPHQPSIGLTALRSPFLEVHSNASPQPRYREMILTSGEKGSISHSASASQVEVVRPLRRTHTRAPTSSLTSPLPYIKRAAPRSVSAGILPY